MKRIPITGENMWFDMDKATKYSEESEWNGNNYISKATGKQCYHENIFVTKSGKYILHSWSNYQGVSETFEEISKKQAANWFSKQGFDLESIPKELIDIVLDNEI